MALGGRRELARVAAVVGLLALTSLVLTSPAPAARTYQLKACINAKTNVVRVVVKSTKCKSAEAYVDLFTSVTTVNSVLTGPVAPVDNLTGRDGDFYVDNLKKQFYGPRVGGKWGPPINIIGAQGPKGEPGPAGPTGSTGSSGSPGPAGPTGAAGAAGAAGATGAAGRTILSGSTSPANTVGTNGDYFIDTATSTLYGPKTSGAWPTGVSLIGPSGGRTILNGTVAPDSATVGSTGDFYIDTVANLIYGPKSGSGWGSGTSIIGATGPKGDTGTVGATGPKGETGTVGATGPKGETGTVADLHYGSFYDTPTIALTQNAATPVPLRVTDFSNGISIQADTQTPSVLTRITMQYAGKYNIAFSIQLSKTGSGTDVTAIWLRKNEIDVAWTSTDIYLAGNNARQVAAWNFFVNAAAGDYYQLMIAAGDNTTSIIGGAGAALPTTPRPEIPGTILTVNQVG